ncbi:hypothetical protein C7N43_19030 [Sphingobacteriales bacterium UPWRP_1]|nr:hypothetical protein BVG80_02890 [Sphingobacteriales bacterium TSM_CSM]PSJ75430.1 hypothetical protein C7N43_19030 [Sphingobacteriales bacterium UPWRP_1]
MKRKDFLKRIGLAGAGLGLPVSEILLNKAGAKEVNSCVLIPTETSGPFPLDLSENTYYFRQDVREDRAGSQLNLKLKIKGTANCEPMPNVRVNIWHCDKDGNYSGYGTQTGQTYLRGYQITNANGEADFVTVFPGWYPGRVCHIHFQVYVSSAYAAISQLTFDHDAVNAVYAANAALYTNGPDPKTPATDNIFSDGYEYQLATLTPNALTGGYDAYLEVTVQGSGTVGLGHIEKETAKHLQLGQNFPNPFTGATTIPFSLGAASNVKLELWNLAGKKAAVLDKGLLPAGNHNIYLNLASLGLPQNTYAYQLVVENNAGIFKDCRLMTALK